LALAFFAVEGYEAHWLRRGAIKQPYERGKAFELRGSWMLATKPDKFPVLTTSRLRLRAPELTDAVGFQKILSNPDVTRFSNWPDAPSKAQAERFARWMCKLYESCKGCAWIIEDGKTGAMIGAIRFNQFDKKSRFGTVGYESNPTSWGRGLMTEALRSVVLCGHQLFGLNRIEAWTLHGNSASDRVLEKSGFQYEGTLRQRAWFKGAFHDFRMFGRVAGDPLN
jgi:[ribosomal protein S5]-alanine N-acetyltransferase